MTCHHCIDDIAGFGAITSQTGIDAQSTKRRVFAIRKILLARMEKTWMPV